MAKLVKWSSDLDLSSFYSECSRRGFVNNTSQKVMINCFDNEKSKQAWILYKESQACGSVICHSLPELGEKSYRICSRTVVFPEYFNQTGLLTKRRMFAQLQQVVTQYYIPAQIAFLGADADMYISSNESVEASQKVVHEIWCPEMCKLGFLTKELDMMYRGHMQTFWKLNVALFLSELDNYPRWD